MAGGYTKPQVWWTERDKIAIATYSDTTDADSKFSGPPGDKDITLFVVKRCDLFTSNLTEDLSSSGLPTEFHDAIVAKGIQRGYEMKDPNLAAYWKNTYNEFVLEGKRYANKGAHANASCTIQGCDY